MEFDRLSLLEIVEISKLVSLMGQPISVEGLQSCCNVLDATLTLYRKQLLKVTEENRRYGE